MASPSPAPVPRPSWRLPDRLAYVVSHAFPHALNGYAERSHEVARALVRLGHDVVVLTRPGRPWDMEGFPEDAPVEPEARIEGVRYLSLPLPPGATGSARRRLAERALSEAFLAFRPAAVLAASGWENAEPALGAARAMRLPFLYEQRGFWEMSRAAADPAYAGSAAQAGDAERDAAIARAARAVVTLTGEMREELLRRGIEEDRILLVPNGAREAPDPVPPLRREDLGLRARRLLGYLGSLSPYEGLEDLVRLVALMRAGGEDVALVVAGSGAPQGREGAADPARDALAALARGLGVEAHVRLLPPIPRDRVGGLYAVLDAVVIPRRADGATALVAPLKPYTAASFGIPVFLSDLPPHRRVAEETGATLFPPGDLRALADGLAEAFRAGHPMAGRPLPPDLSWRARLRPLSRLLRRLAEAEAPRLARALPRSEAPAGAAPGPDLRLPEVMLADILSPRPETVAGIGPCAGFADRPGFVALSRGGLLGRLATLEPGLFLVDWAGLRGSPGEWEGLWSAGNMRLSRLLMEAARIGQARGWRMRVLGRPAGAEAPLFRTVAALFEVAGAEGAGAPGPEAAPPGAEQGPPGTSEAAA